MLVDSHRALLLHEHGHLPRAYFPRDDVRMDLLAPGTRVARSATRDGGTYWTARVGGRVAQDAAWSYPDPPLDGLVAFHVRALDAWWEEDERMLSHVRDPYHRCDALPSSRRVRLLIDGTAVADSTRAHVLYETGLPPRWYLPREDVSVRFDADGARDVVCLQGARALVDGGRRRAAVGERGVDVSRSRAATRVRWRAGWRSSGRRLTTRSTGRSSPARGARGASRGGGGPYGSSSGRCDGGRAGRAAGRIGVRGAAPGDRIPVCPISN